MVHLFTSFTYNDPCQLVKAGRAFNPKIQKISYIYKYKYQLLKSWYLLLFFRFTYHISKTPIPLEKVGWGMIFSNPIPVSPAAAVSDLYPAFECHIWRKRVSYMMLPCVIYDTCLRHIWWWLTSYMILVCVIYDDCLRHIWCRLVPYWSYSDAL